MTYPVKSPRKLIEVALPLDAINVAAAREKSIRHGHPSTLHLWWARRPLAAARAVIFAQLVNDPGYQQGGGFKYGVNKKEAAVERKRLFKIIEDLVQWENTTKEKVLEPARAEIRRSWREVCELNKDHPQAAELFNPEKLPALHDPFAGGGAIPLEAQRLGLEAYASDLNPVAVLINKAMIEIPPRFAEKDPVNPAWSKSSAAEKMGRTWKGAAGLAEDVRYYGAWMREEAQKRIGHLYPPVEITADMARERPDLKPLVGQKLTVIAWLWARTVKSPNPAFSHVDVPLVGSFMLATKPGKEAYIEPVIDGDKYRFVIRNAGNAGFSERDFATSNAGTKLARGANFRCLMSNTPIPQEYIRDQFRAKKVGNKMMTIVAEGIRERVYLCPTPEMEDIAIKAVPGWVPDQEMNQDSSNLVSGRGYSITHWHEMFTDRQLTFLTTLSDLVSVASDLVLRDCNRERIGISNPNTSQGRDARSYAGAIALYLAFGIDRMANYCSKACTWHSGIKYETITSTFGRQALPMTWDYAEANPLSDASGNWQGGIVWIANTISLLPYCSFGFSQQANASNQTISSQKIVSTDPPYYDNIAYADLSDYFYIWLRRSLRNDFPDLFASIAVPKDEELVATPYRHGGKAKAETFFLDGMTLAINRIGALAHSAFPVTIYYAFKQSETQDKVGTASTGWETFLEAVTRAGFALTGTWPMRTELVGNLKKNVSALASSIILVCRKRPTDAPTISRREFLRELNAVLPEALDEMTKGAGGEYSPVAPVDLSQAIIGPGMAVFSKYAAVLEADGSPMSVRTALQLINRFLAEDDFDPDTQFCLRWFEQHGWGEGVFGAADVLARAKGTSVNGVRDAGVVESGGGKVRLRKWAEYPGDWDPHVDTRNPVWETLHHLIRALKSSEGETGGGRVLAAVKGKAEAARQLAYRLYTLCERQGWAEDARAYNELITSWAGIESAAGVASAEKPADLFR